MSTRTLGRRLFIAALGVASLTAVMYLVNERRRRKLQTASRGVDTAALADSTSKDDEQQQATGEILPKTANATNKVAVGDASNAETEMTKRQEEAVASAVPNTTVTKEERKQEMVSADDHIQVSEPPSQEEHQKIVDGKNSEVENNSFSTTTSNEASMNGHANMDEPVYVEVKHQNGLRSQPPKEHRPKSPVSSLKPKVEKNKSSFQQQQTKNEANATPVKEATLTPLPAENGYQNAESPSTTSTNSDGSADSGRATGGPTCSPFDNHGDMEVKPVYEFEVPNTLVGLIIGVQGKTITELCRRASVRMLIRPHHTQSRFDSHQICSIEGPRNNINKCLHMIRYRFPADRFPDLNLKPVLPPSMLECTAPIVASEPSTLSLPVGVPCEAFISNVVDPGHFFVQLPTHPTFPSLTTLDQYTMNIYSQLTGIPILPKPCVAGLVCVAPTSNGWHRAITLDYNERADTVIVRLADYGGFMELPRSELRQIRSDLTTLPMQAIECYLAKVQPIDGTSRWSDKAVELFTKLCASRIVQAELVGYNKENNIPFVDVYAMDENKKVCHVNQVFLERGFAKPSDPTKLLPLQPTEVTPSYSMRKPAFVEASNRR